MQTRPTKERLNKVSHAVRAAQAVLQYGVGAMVDFPDQTLMTASPEFWKENVIQIHDERFEKALNVSYFGMPGGQDLEGFADGISYVRFPEWYFCPKCRKFQPLSKWLQEYRASRRYSHEDPHMIRHMKCNKCNQSLAVSRIIVVCPDGHIDDFPWIKWVHRRNMGGSKAVCDSPNLLFDSGNSNSEGLEGIKIRCTNCNACATLQGAFSPDVFEKLDEQDLKSEYICRGRHPHKHQKLTCNKYPKTIQRGASSVYFPVVLSSLVIPPYAEKLTELIEKSKAFSRCIDRIHDEDPEDREKKITRKLADWADEIACEIGKNAQDIQHILVRKWLTKDDNDPDVTDLKYRAQEFEALGTETTNSHTSLGDFCHERYNVELYDIPQLSKVVLVNKIREVRALVGFSRIQPAVYTENPGEKNFVSSKLPKMDWYPGYEVRGEGIFLEFKSEPINEWISQNQSELSERIDALNRNYMSSFVGKSNPRTVSAKFVLLHTVAHLLIKQLSFECGYSVASLRERIYCSEKREGKEMSGIFIYTASGDSEGTLGGLVRQGKPDFLGKIFRKAIESAETCSNDPICILSNGQGKDSLNLAACHACALIPETGCEEYNVFLDRGLVVGTLENKKLGFFSR